MIGNSPDSVKQMKNASNKPGKSNKIQKYDLFNINKVLHASNSFIIALLIDVTVPMKKTEPRSHNLRFLV